MKFGFSIEIDQSRDKVVEVFIDPQYLGNYQEGFLRKQLVSGEPGRDGAVSKMYYAMGKGEMELTETVTSNRLPDSFAAEYHHKHMDNTLLCRFIALDDNRTRYETEGEYTAFRGIVPKLMATFMPGMFRKQALKWAMNFKAFAEQR